MVRINRLGPKRRRSVPTKVNDAIHRVGPALDLIAAKYPQNLPMKEWARPCHVSATHFRRLFRHAIGQSPHQYLTELRVRMGTIRLRTTKEKILTIAEDVGFPTLSSFNRSFRQIMKMTPRQWRTHR